jgi:glycosyltransferase involved in cell wall biosynthesis
MIKVLMVAYTNYLTDARPRREAETLAARGDEVDFISLAEKCHPSEEVVNGVRVLRLSMVRYRGAGGLKYVLSYLKFFNKASIKVVSLYIAKRYDVIHIHTMPDFLVFVAIIPKLMGAKVILDVHDMMPELYMSKFGIKESHWLIKLIKLQEFVSTGFADRVICVHDLHKKVLLERHSSLKSLTVLLNVPDPNVFGDLSQVKKTN